MRSTSPRSPSACSAGRGEPRATDSDASAGTVLYARDGDVPELACSGDASSRAPTSEAAVALSTDRAVPVTVGSKHPGRDLLARSTR